MNTRQKNKEDNNIREGTKNYFEYMKNKKGLDCNFPTIFNGQKVLTFDRNGRPIDEDGRDMIDQYWLSVPGGFEINGEIDNLCELYHRRVTDNYDANYKQKQNENAKKRREKLKELKMEETKEMFGTMKDFFECLKRYKDGLQNSSKKSLKQLTASGELNQLIVDKKNIEQFLGIKEGELVDIIFQEFNKNWKEWNWYTDRNYTRLIFPKGDSTATLFGIEKKIDIIFDEEEFRFFFTKKTLYISERFIRRVNGPVGLAKEMDE